MTRKQQLVLTSEGSEELKQCRRLLERRDSMPWSNARVVHWALVSLKSELEVIDKAQALQAKETEDGR